MRAGRPLTGIFQQRAPSFKLFIFKNLFWRYNPYEQIQYLNTSSVKLGKRKEFQNTDQEQSQNICLITTFKLKKKNLPRKFQLRLAILNIAISFLSSKNNRRFRTQTGKERLASPWEWLSRIIQLLHNDRSLTFLTISFNMILPQIEMNDLSFGRWKKTLTKGKYMMLQNRFFLNKQIIQRKLDINKHN